MRKSYAITRQGNEWVSQEMDCDDLSEMVKDMNGIVWFCLKLIFWPITLTVWIVKELQDHGRS